MKPGLKEGFTSAVAALEASQKEKQDLITSNPLLTQLLDLLLGTPLYLGFSQDDPDGRYYATTATRKRVEQKLESGELLELLNAYEAVKNLRERRDK